MAVDQVRWATLVSGATLAPEIRAAYDGIMDVGCAIATLLGTLDAAKVLRADISGDEMIRALEAVQADVVRARDAAIGLMVRTGQS